MKPITVLIADDHLFYREGVRALLKNVPDVEVVGEASTGEETVERAEVLQPDVILMDIKMPELNGIEATRTILSKHPEIAILVVTMFEDDESVFAAMRAGARGYLLKDADQEELAQAVYAVSRGQAIFSPPIARRLIHYFGALSARIAQSASALPFPDLTEREREVLTLIAQGHNNNEIAHRLSISVKTVQNYVSTILSKLQVADRYQAIVRAREAGLDQE
jgi:DNA-binding NarL/FixJ family response regulator